MAGRPKGSVSTKNTEIKDKSVTKIKEENKLLRKELDEMKKLILSLSQSQNATQDIALIQDANIDDSDIRPNKYIKVMSLNFGLLVMSTEGKGRGKIFKFPKFGDVRNIVYSDLANLIHHQQKFAEEGRFYIFDKQVVENHGLVEYYNKFMTKEMIENILENSRDEIVNLFNNTTETQKEVIVDILTKKIIDDEEVDLNKVDVISRIYGKNIYDLAMETKEFKNNK